MKFYNTLTGKKEEFQPAADGRVGIYVCGITAYDSCHLGHARAAVSFDVIVRYLRSKKYRVTYVRNYTDVDDKIINRANKEGRDCRDIAEQYIAEYKKEMALLGNVPPDIEPKATKHIPDMIAVIEKLIDRGFAYVRGGDVFYSVRKFADYGRLSGKRIDELEAGARVDVNEAKDDPLDFALWKAGRPGEPKWPSPWGDGRPGWHIECSAMSTKYLGQPFDIHGGGRDLVFPHHENEIAQAEGAEGKQFVKYWLHNGFVNINSEKMSKSLGNFAAINEVIKRHGAEAVRYFIISNHYRSPIDYTEKAMADASLALDRFYETAKRMPPPLRRPKTASPNTPAEKALAEALDSAEKAVAEFMDDDFNTAGAIGVIFDVVRTANRYLDESAEKGNFYLWALTRWTDLKLQWRSIFGLFGTNPDEYFRSKKALTAGTADEAEILRMIKERESARARKDFAAADGIRKRLDEMGIIIKDKPDGATEWRYR